MLLQIAPALFSSPSGFNTITNTNTKKYKYKKYKYKYKTNTNTETDTDTKKYKNYRANPSGRLAAVQRRAYPDPSRYFLTPTF